MAWKFMPFFCARVSDSIGTDMCSTNHSTYAEELARQHRPRRIREPVMKATWQATLRTWMCNRLNDGNLRSDCAKRRGMT
eukprot:755029-Hanusia_phi.AAC.5